MAFSPLSLTNGRIEVWDNRSECDDRQLNGLLPFGPLMGTTLISQRLVNSLRAQTDVLWVFRVIGWLRPEDKFSIW
jgi:hypothetical protein